MREIKMRRMVQNFSPGIELSISSAIWNHNMNSLNQIRVYITLYILASGKLLMSVGYIPLSAFS